MAQLVIISPDVSWLLNTEVFGCFSEGSYWEPPSEAFRNPLCEGDQLIPLPVSTLWPVHVHPLCDLPIEAITYSLPESNGIPLRRGCVSGSLLSGSVQTQVQGVVSRGLQAGLGALAQGSVTNTSLSPLHPLSFSFPHEIINESPLLWSRMALSFSRP